MAVNYMISLDILKRDSFIDENIEDSVLLVVLKRVQDLYIEPILGTPLYNAILDKIENDTMAVPYTTLMDDYILPYLYSACELVAVNHLNTQIRNKGVGKSSDEDISAASEQEMNYLKRSFNDFLEKYQAKLIGHLKDSCADDTYPEYSDYDATKAEQVKPKTDTYLNRFSFLGTK